MLAFGVMIYGFLLSFVLSAATRNKREGRKNPLMVSAMGYVLCGISAGAAAMLPVWAAYDPAGAATLVNLG